jgi:hypothetical protein
MIKFVALSVVCLLPCAVLAYADASTQPETRGESFVGLETGLLGIGLNPPRFLAGTSLSSQLSIFGYVEANTLAPFADPVEKANGEFEKQYGELGAGVRFFPWAGSFFAESILSYGTEKYYETLSTAGRNYASDYLRVQGGIGNKWNIYDFSVGVKWLTLGSPIWEDIRVWRISDYKSNKIDEESVSDLESSGVHRLQPSMFDVFVEYRF